MARYWYTGFSHEGELQKGHVNARSEEEAKQTLWGQGFTITLMREQGAGRSIRLIESSHHRRVRQDDMIDFAQRLATLLSAGLPLLRAFKMLAQQSESRNLGKTLEEVSLDIASGSTLHQAMAKHPKVFSNTWIEVVRSGELSGHLPQCLTYLSDFLDKRRAVQQKILTALTYPAILILVTFSVTWFLVYQVVPKFADFYAGFGNAQLPLLTLDLIRASNLLRQYALIILACLGVTGYIVSEYIKTDVGRWQFDAFKLQAPIVGRLLYYSSIERFTANLEMLMHSNISLLTSMQVMGNLFQTSPIFYEAIAHVCEKIAEGNAFSASLAETRIFTPFLTNMVDVGEQSGKLPEMLTRVNQYYRFQIEMFSARMSSSIEPAIIIAMGIVIGTVLLALYLPIFNLASVAR